MTDKTKSQTYNFLLENKSIEDIKNQTNTTLKEKRRHGGSSFKIIEKITANDQQLNDDLSEEEIFYDAVEDLNNISTEKISQFQTIIQELEKANQQLKNEKLKLKQNNVNFDKYSYNVITIYDEKQRKKTGIEKIHEEILPIEDKIFFITTFVYINHSITENVFFFHKDSNCNMQVINQFKNYQNINEYTKDISLKDISLIDKKNNNINKMTVKEFLKNQQDFKLKPTKTEKTLWYIFTGITLLIFISSLLLLVPQIACIGALVTGINVTVVIMGGTRMFASIFSSAIRKVDVWFSNKIYKNKKQKEKQKKERQSIIKNLSTDKLETKLETQYEILKQELDNRKNMKPNKIIKKIINHNLNNISQNLDIESENNHNFDSSIRDTVNNQDRQPSTSSNHNWNKVKCLLR